VAVEALRAQDAAPASLDERVLAEQCRTMRERNRSRASFTPSRFGGTLTLFRAGTDTEWHARFFAGMEGLGEEERWTLGWCGFADAPVEVYPVPGTHSVIAAEPHVRVLAGCMREALAAARGRAADASAEAARRPALCGAP